MLGGLGGYRIKTGTVGINEAVTQNGFHVGFGTRLGPLGFVEIRYVQIAGDARDTRYIPVTLGIRF